MGSLSHCASGRHHFSKRLQNFCMTRKALPFASPNLVCCQSYPVRHNGLGQSAPKVHDAERFVKIFEKKACAGAFLCYLPAPFCLFLGGWDGSFRATDN
jgi:hypothetical protein